MEGTAVLSSDNIGPVRDGWETGAEGAIISPGFGSKSINIGCFYPVITVGTDVVVA